MSSDAANPQAHETTCCPSDPPYDWLKPFITDVFNSCMQYFVATEFITEVSDWNVEVLWSTVVEIVLSRSKQCYVHYIYWFNNCSKYISVLKAFGPVEDYHNIHTYYFGTVLSWSRKYIFRKEGNIWEIFALRTAARIKLLFSCLFWTIFDNLWQLRQFLTIEKRVLDTFDI